MAMSFVFEIRGLMREIKCYSNLVNDDNDGGPLSHICASWLQTCTLYVLQIQFKLYMFVSWVHCLKPLTGDLQDNGMCDLNTIQRK